MEYNISDFKIKITEDTDNIYVEVWDKTSQMCLDEKVFSKKELKEEEERL